MTFTVLMEALSWLANPVRALCMAQADTELMERLRDDELADAALAELVRRYQDELVGFFYHHCWDQTLAEELAQTVFVKIYQARERYTVSAKVRTYLYRIAHNAWIDHVRRTRRYRATSLDAERGRGGLRLADTLVAPEAPQIREDSQVRARVEEALHHLPEGQRAVFLLANNQGLRYQDIAEILNIPEGTVKSRMFGAVRRLRELLKDLVEDV